jgi:N-sulfoglucosamine sulfohydrolase
MTSQNVIVITCHDLGQHITPYGVNTVHTPALERLADNGVTFVNSFCTSPGCSPSRASIFTGRYPHSTGVMGLCHGPLSWGLNSDEIHLAQLLRANGYHTALAGGWHEHNIDDFARLGFAEKLTDASSHYVPARQVADGAENYLDRMSGSETPFFLCVGLYEPHRKFDFGGVAADASKGVFIPEYIPTDTPGRKQAALKEFSELQGAIREADKAVGRILAKVQAAGLEQNTVIIFTADHGVAMPHAKGSLYDPGIEVPLIIQAPCWGITPGQRPEGMISNVDYVPTLLEGLGIEVPNRVQGISQLSHLKGGEPVRTEIFAEKNFHCIYDPIRCIRTNKFKYIVNFELNPQYIAPFDIAKGEIFKSIYSDYSGSRAQFELYDLNDVWERNNLAGDEAYSEVKKELHEKLVNWMRKTADPLLQGPIKSKYFSRIITENFS